MTVPLKTRILLADDHAMVRKGLRLVLDAEPGRFTPAPAVVAPAPPVEPIKEHSSTTVA